MLIRLLSVTALITLTLLFTGCNGSNETDDASYILLIGVDKAEGGKQRITCQVAVPRGLRGSGDNGGSGEKGSDQKAAWVLNTIMTPAPAEMDMLLNSTMSRAPKNSHVQIIIFSEAVAREGLDPHINHFIRSRDFRETLFLIVVKGAAEEYIKQNNPKLEATTARYFETVFSTAKSGYYLPATLHGFYTRRTNAGGSPYVLYSGINPLNGQNKPVGDKTPEQKGNPYISGELPRTGTESPADFASLAVFRGDKMIGVLNSDETRAVAILQGKALRSYIGVIDPLQPKKHVINLDIRCDHKPKITATLHDGTPAFDVAVEIEAEVLSISSGINYEAPDYRILLENQVANLIKGQIMTMIKHTQELGTDPVGFGVYLRPQFQSTNQLNQTDLTALYQAADICVNVTAKIRRTGREWRSSPDRKE